MDTSPQINTADSLFKRILLGKPFLIGVVLLLMYTLIGFFLTPRLVKNQLENYVVHQLERRLDVDKVRVNPFTLTVELTNMALREANDAPLFALKRFFANFELKSLFRWAWTFKEISLIEPKLVIKLEPNGQLNLSRMATDAVQTSDASTDAADQPDESDGPIRLFFDHIHIDNGNLVYADLADATPASINIESINFDLRQLSTIPDREGSHTISATFPEGGAFKWTGNTLLNPFESKGQLEFRSFKKGLAWRFLQDELNIVRPAGSTDLKMNYFVSLKNGDFQFVLDDVSVLVSDLELALKDEVDTRILSLDRIELSKGRFDLASRVYSIGRLDVADGALRLHTDKNGRLNWQRLPSDSPVRAREVDSTKETETKPFDLKFEQIDLNRIAVKYIDDSRLAPMDLDVGQLDLSFSARVSNKGEPASVNAGTVLDDITVALGDVVLRQRAESEPLVVLPRAEVAADLIDFLERRIRVNKVALSGGRVALWLNNDRAINFGRFKRRQVHAEASPAANRSDASSDDERWSFHLSEADLNDFELTFDDRGLSPSNVYHLTDIDLGLTNFNSTPKEALNYQFTFNVKQGGEAAVNGTANFFKPAFTADLKLNEINLTPLGAYLGSIARLSLDAGLLSLNANIDNGNAETDEWTASGAGSLDKLLLTLPTTGETLLTWKQLDTQGIHYANGPAGLRIDDVRFVAPRGKLVIRKDKTTNVAELVVTPKKESSPKGNTNTFPIDIKRMRIEKGELDFADLSLIFPFKVRIHDLKGALAGLSSDSASHASIDLTGGVQQYGAVKINGNLQPFDLANYLDVTMRFDNLELTKMTPYSAEFAGRRISSGKLNLDLQYKVSNSQLKADNNIVLDSFILGEHVEAPRAVNLPLDLAIALLKDADGRIDIGLPISGNLKDPEFGYGHLIWKALVNLITKIVAAPFKALGALLGEDQEEYGYIAFEAGIGELSPPQKEKIARLVEALQKRPQLQLEVKGCHDPKTDGVQIKESQLKRDLAELAGMPSDFQQFTDAVDFTDLRVQEAMAAVAAERLAPKEIEKIKIEFNLPLSNQQKVPSNDKKKSPPTPSTPDLVGYYQQIFDLLVMGTSLGKNDLTALSQERSGVIAKELIETNGLPGNRIRILDPVESEETENSQILCPLNLSTK